MKLYNSQNILDHIEIFILNLSKNIDRKNNMIKLMKKINITNYKFIIPLPATKKTKEILIKKKYIINKNIYLNLHKCSLYATYVKIFEKMLKQRDKYFIIFQDDLIINDKINITNIKNYMNNIIININKINPNFNLIYFEYCFNNCKYNKKINDIIKLYNPLCQGCILYNNNKLKDTIHQLKQFYKYHPFNNNLYIFGHYLINYSNGVDTIYQTLIKEKKITAYSSIKPIFIQNIKFESDLPHFGSFKWIGQYIQLTPCKSDYLLWKIYNYFLIFIFIIFIFIIIKLIFIYNKINYGL